MLENITRKQCDDFIAHLSTLYKPSTINIRFRHLNAAFNKAIEWGYTFKSPFEYIRQIPIKDDLPQVVMPDEINNLLAVIDKKEFKEYVQTCLYTAGRRTEVAKLEWQDIIDNNNGNYDILLRVSKSKVKRIPLAEKLQEVLFYRKKKSGPIFPYYYIYTKNASKHFRRYADKVSLNGVKLYSMRHTSATYMIMQGIPIRIVQTILGHSSVKTTERYTKLITEQLRDAIDKIKF